MLGTVFSLRLHMFAIAAVPNNHTLSGLKKSGSGSRSVMSDSATPRTVACQAPLSMKFSRQEYWSGLPFPSPEDLSNTGIKPISYHPNSCRNQKSGMDLTGLQPQSQ